MRRIIIALVALVGFAGLAEAHPRHHRHHHHRHFGYTHHHHNFHFRGYRRHHLRFRGHHRHHHRFAHGFEREAAAAPAWVPAAQPWGFGAPGQTYPQPAAPQAVVRPAFRAAEQQPFIRPRSSLAGSGGGQIVRASWYGGGERLSPRTASGERFNRGGLTAAHRTLPFGTRVSVTNPQTGASVVVRINDRGPFVRGRSLDLARGAAQAIGLRSTSAVRMVVLN